MARALAARGLDVVTFNFLYTEAKRRLPDKTAVLEATWRAVRRRRARARDARASDGSSSGGKSMGGRIATQVAAEPEAIGDARGPRAPRLPAASARAGPTSSGPRTCARVQAPMLFVQGSRDAFGTPASSSRSSRRWRRAARGSSPIEGGDHSLVTPEE